VNVLELLASACLVAGCFFFLAGTLGILRFPDVLSRLHAVTKADNLGLGLVVLGLGIHSGSLLTAAKLALIWVVALIASATSSYLIAASIGRSGGGVAERR
jgi:multicomponent Na+:H+ antiporter subunit G